ncbi:hypothetical protein Drorol1_Dr00011723 [Drosera rotundifolia]
MRRGGGGFGGSGGGRVAALGRWRRGRWHVGEVAPTWQSAARLVVARLVVWTASGGCWGGAAGSGAVARRRQVGSCGPLPVADLVGVCPPAAGGWPASSSWSSSSWPDLWRTKAAR